jgi:AraC-like DNA-binding protein
MNHLPERAVPEFRMLADLAPGETQDQLTRHVLPATLGTGQVTVVAVGPGLTVALQRLQLHQALQLKRLADPEQAEELLISFQTVGPLHMGVDVHLSAIQLISADIGFTTRLPAHTDLFTVTIAVQKALLATWLTPLPEWVRNLLNAQQPAAYDALLTPELQMVLVQLATAEQPHRWDAFYYQIKAQELLYFLFRELDNRAAAPTLPLHTAEVEALFRVREQVLADLATPPHLPALAAAAGLNEAKLQGLFRQIFGTSIYQYYQAARMNEAKLRLAHYSVSEVGYQLGFTNLSHFARLFAKHCHCTPKRYQATLQPGS